MMSASQSDRGRDRSRRQRYDDGGWDAREDNYRDRSARSRSKPNRNVLVKQPPPAYAYETRVETYSAGKPRGMSLGPSYAAAAAADGSHGHHHRRTGRPAYSVSPPPSGRRRDSSNASGDRGRSESRKSQFMDIDLKDRRKWEHALEVGLKVAAVQAFRLRGEPGDWRGPKGGRVATAALGAATIDFLLENKANDPDRHAKRRMVESTIGGLVLSRVLNGPRKDLRRS